MRRWAGTMIGLAVAIVATVALAPALIGPFFDRIYYSGPVSSHFDGRRFFIPGNAPSRPWPAAAMVPYLIAAGTPGWPESVPVTPTRPPRREQGDAMRVTWIGHATVLVQTQGLNILTDPVWSDRISPHGHMGPRRVRAPGVRMADLPPIDLVLLSHNHYDHLDLPTLKQLWERDHPLIVTTLGNDTILADAGIGVVARDWGGRVPVAPGIDVVVERVDHWSGRWFRDFDRALWAGFTVTLPGGNLFFAGDSMLGDGAWMADARRQGMIRLAILPLAAFRPPGLIPEKNDKPFQAVEMFAGLDAAYALGVHWGTFPLSDQPMDAPVRLLRAARQQGLVPPGRLRITEPGVSWLVPPLDRAGR